MESFQLLPTDKMVIVLRNEKPLNIYMLNEEEEILMLYSPMLLHDRRIAISQDAWVSKMTIIQRHVIDQVRLNCNESRVYSRKGKF